MSVREDPHYRTFLQRGEVMTNKLAKLIPVAVITLILVACGSDSNDVPSLSSEGTQRAEPTEQSADANLDEAIC